MTNYLSINEIVPTNKYNIVCQNILVNITLNDTIIGRKNFYKLYMQIFIYAYIYIHTHIIIYIHLCVYILVYLKKIGNGGDKKLMLHAHTMNNLVNVMQLLLEIYGFAVDAALHIVVH